MDSIDTVTLPFEDFVCPTCANDTCRKACSDCGCVKCLLKTGDPLVSVPCSLTLLLHFTVYARYSISATATGTLSV